VEASIGVWARIKSKPFAIWLIFGGLVYFGIVLLAFVVPVLISDPAAFLSNPLGAIVLVFIALFLATAFLVLRGRRWSLALAAGVSIFFLLIFSPFFVPSLANPADPSFSLAMTGLPALILVAIFSVLSLVKAKTGLAHVSYLGSPKSSGGLFAIAVVGFVIGGLVVGSVASLTITRLLAGGGQAADIRIVSGAMAGPAGGIKEPFSPTTFTVRVGGTVTWFNGDTVQHSVTTNATPAPPAAFDSGLLDPGARWSHTFTVAGTYEYHCTPHAMSMWGKVVVTP
jgi:plastocyanin